MDSCVCVHDVTGEEMASGCTVGRKHKADLHNTRQVVLMLQLIRVYEFAYMMEHIDCNIQIIH